MSFLVTCNLRTSQRAGAFASVWLCHDRHSLVALKVPGPKVTHRPMLEVVMRFFAKVQSGGKIPKICTRRGSPWLDAPHLH